MGEIKFKKTVQKEQSESEKRKSVCGRRRGIEQRRERERERECVCV